MIDKLRRNDYYHSQLARIHHPKNGLVTKIPYRKQNSKPHDVVMKFPYSPPVPPSVSLDSRRLKGDVVF
jgi:hypothetical protein